MRAHRLSAWLAAVVVGALPCAPAQASIYTWIDAKGAVNVSNLPPPEGVRLIRETPDPPRDPAREAAVREAARQYEVQALQGQVMELRQELEQTRRETAPPMPYVSQTVIVYPPAPQSAPEPSWPQTEYLQAMPNYGGCDFGFNCGFWGSAGFYPGVVVVGVPAARYPAPNRHAPRRDTRPFVRPPFSLQPLVAAPGLIRR